ncbi:MAG: hypothetical protein WAJ93_13830 [Candidatus Nitrosopolaris sp.]
MRQLCHGLNRNRKTIVLISIRRLVEVIGFNMDYRIVFVIDFLKRRKPQEFYDHRTVEFVPLDKPEIQKARSDPKNEQNLYNYM